MNMRKIIAVLAAVLMLCAVVPMGVFAAPGDVVISKNFDDGSVFSNARAENGYMVFDATTADWANVYLYANALKNATKYEITFDCKANKAANINVKINNNWSGDTFKWTTNVTTEWETYSCVITTNELKELTSTALLMFTSNTTAANGAIYHIDNVVVKEYAEPVAPGNNLFVNGDFETGNTNGWNKHQQTTVTAAAAKSGNYGAYLNGDSASWGGVLDQKINVEDGKTYTFSFDYMAVRQGFNYKLTGVQSGATYVGNYISTASWTHVEKEITVVGDTQLNINFNCGGQSGTDEMYVDNVSLKEVVAPSFDGYIYNGDFETGKTQSWTALWNSTALEIVEGKNGGSALKGTASGAWNITYQEVAVTPNTNYTVWAYAKDASASALWIKNAGGNGDITSKNFANGSDWSLTSVSFNSGSNNTVWVGLMGLEAGGTYTVDDIFMFEAVPQSNDGYIVNGTFETGSVSPWDNLWGSCPTVEIIKGGKDSTFALNLVSGEWKHLRQTNIAVEANTEYKITLWSKNVKNISLLVKDGGDSANIVNKGIANSADWAKTEITFNTGANTTILVSFMGGAAEAYGTFDSIVMEKLHTCNVVEQDRVEADCENDGYISYACDCGLGAYTETIPATGHTAGNEATCEEAQTCSTCGAELAAALGHNYSENVTPPTCTEDGLAVFTCDNCGDTYEETIPAEHTYTDDCDSECDVCGEWRFDAPHNLTYVPGVVPTSCLETGYDEYWECTACGAYFGDAEASGQINPEWMYYTGECVRPEGAIPCAVVPCEICGNDTYGDASCTRPENSPACQDAVCVYCGEQIWGEGHSYGYDEETWESLIPLCQPGDCIHCGEHLDYIYECENGSWAPCSYDGECSFGCGKQYPATGEHVFDDGVTACDGGMCWLCWEEIEPADHVYDDDFDTDCNVCGAVRELSLPIASNGASVSEDANGLAVRFEAEVNGLSVLGSTNIASYTNASLDGYKLVEMGAEVYNGFTTIAVKAVYLTSLEETSAGFAVRVINIPERHLATEITYTPYYIVEMEGVQVTLYGTAFTGSYSAYVPAE